MSIRKRGNYKNPFARFTKGMVWFFTGSGGRQEADSLDEALDTLAAARCCGIDCCDNSIKLKHSITKVPLKIQITGEPGSYVLTITEVNPVT